MSYLREVKKGDGSDIFIGSLAIITCLYGELMGSDGVVDWENKKKLEDENKSLKAGDAPSRIGKPSLTCIRYKASDIHPLPDYLAASHHRQGIMADAVDTVLHNWAIPRMNVRHMLVAMFKSNEGSVKVFLSNGFQMEVT